MAERIDPAANVYARALHGAAVDAGRVAEVDANLRQFNEALASNVLLLRALINPELPADAKKRIISQMMDGCRADRPQRPAAPGRQPPAGAAARPPGRLQRRWRRSTRRSSTSRSPPRLPLNDSERAELERRISGAVGQTARVQASVDPDIIGGLVLACPRRPSGRLHPAPPAGAAAHPCAIPPFQLGVKRESASGRDCCNPQNRDRALRGFGRGRGGRDGHSDRRRYRPHLRPRPLCRHGAARVRPRCGRPGPEPGRRQRRRGAVRRVGQDQPRATPCAARAR